MEISRIAFSSDGVTMISRSNDDTLKSMCKVPNDLSITYLNNSMGYTAVPSTC
jgi:hypothetical protein